MSVIEKISELEKKYQVKSIRSKGIVIWPLIRIYLSYEIFGKNPVKVKRNKAIRYLKNCFYGFGSWFKKYDILVFNESGSRKIIDHLYYDKFDFIDKKYRVLFVELPNPNHYYRTLIPTKHIVSKIPLYLLIEVLKRTKFRNAQIENNEVLKTMQNNLQFKTDYNSLVKQFFSQHYIGKLISKIYRPKAVFFTSYFTNMGYVKAFKEFNIPTIELQHGVINEEHFAYRYFIENDKTLFPDFFLTFGKSEKKVFDLPNQLIDVYNVFETGHFYIDYISKNSKNDPTLTKIKKPYKRSLAVSGQVVYDIKIWEIIEDSAKRSPDTLFCIIPRNVEDNYYSRQKLPNNVHIITHLNCYETIISCDFHCTVNSSCSIESISLGVPNILLNIEDKAKQYYENKLSPKFTFFANNAMELLSLIESIDVNQMNRKEIIDSNNEYIVPNFEKNLNQFIDKLLNV
ncbi:MAG: hypothetical protein JXR60_00210 [Bacteroidales bacterium]|nr:hypothetical protein [Bacteroidales bacterium]